MQAMGPTERLISKVRATIDHYRMVAPRDRVVVAVSGGPDSVCLLDVLYRLREDLSLGLSIAHFDHGFRPGQDEAETRFVASLANAYGIPFETAKAKGLRPEIPSLEERARTARYRFLEEVRSRLIAQKIALGHHLDDQAETVIMHLLRGSGPSGLAGILPCREKTFIRPLIRVNREEIEAYLGERALRHVVDPSNLDLRRTRNWVRFDLIPRMRARQPRVAEVLGRTGEILAEDEDCLARQARAWVDQLALPEGGERMEIPLGALRQLPKALSSRVIRHVLERIHGDLHRISHRHIQAVFFMMDGLRPQAQVDLPNRMVVERVYEKIVFRMGSERASRDYAYSLEGPGTYHLEVPRCTIVLEEVDADGLSDLGGSGSMAFMDADKIPYPLVARNFRPGDRFAPLGMVGHKKVKAFFSDLKVPSSIRNRVPILTSMERPAWICGFRIDERVKVTPVTRRVLKGTFADWDSGLSGGARRGLDASEELG